MVSNTKTYSEGTVPALVWCSEPFGSTKLGGRLESERHFFQERRCALQLINRRLYGPHRLFDHFE